MCLDPLDQLDHPDHLEEVQKEFQVHLGHQDLKVFKVIPFILKSLLKFVLIQNLHLARNLQKYYLML